MPNKTKRTIIRRDVAVTTQSGQIGARFENGQLDRVVLSIDGLAEPLVLIVSGTSVYAHGLRGADVNCVGYSLSSAPVDLVQAIGKHIAIACGVEPLIRR